MNDDGRHARVFPPRKKWNILIDVPSMQHSVRVNLVLHGWCSRKLIIFHEMIGVGEATTTTTRYSSEFIKMVKQYETTTPYTPLQSTLTRHLGLERWGPHPLEGFRSIEQYHDVDELDASPLILCWCRLVFVLHSISSRAG